MSTRNRKSSFVLRIALASVLVLVFSTPVVTPAEAMSIILYVAPTGLTTGSCASWANACNLQYALGRAAPGSALWVKKGTYRPTSSTDRTVSFVLKNGVALYGGFAATETALTQRNPAANITILSGDIGMLNNTDDNSYHVLTGGGTNNTAILDGFTVRAGNANADISPNGVGGGMYNLSGSPKLTNVTFSGNSARTGGGMYNESNSNPVLMNVTFNSNSATSGNGGGLLNVYSSPRLTDVTFSGNSATYGDGGGLYTVFGSPTLTNVAFNGNSATFGGGMINDTSSATLTNVTFNGNSATYGGGLINGGSSSLTLTNVTFSNNSATFGGGMYNLSTSPMLTNVTFNNNSATSLGGGMFNAGNPILTNVTFSANSATYGGGMYNRDSNGDPTLTNVTFSANSATSGGGMFNESYSYPIIRNSILYGDTGGEIVSMPGWPGNGPIVSYSDVQGGYPGTGNINVDPLLGPLANNGGFAQTMALGEGSPAIDAGDDANCPAQDQRGVRRPQGSHCDMGAYEAGDITVIIGGLEVGSYTLEAKESTRQSYANVNRGPMKIVNTKGMPLIAAERVIYKVNGVNTSFSEMTGLPASQVDLIYWLPWYNNVDLDTQLRFANVSASPATVHVLIGGQEMQGSPFMLETGASTRKNFPGVNNGPVKIVSDQNIVAAERVIYKVNNVNTSFSEMMALPNSQLDTTYWLPWYNNVDLDTQLRFANVTNQTATVHVYIGEVEMQDSPFTLAAGESTRKSFAGVNNGPVQIVSDQDIVAAERLIYKVNWVNTSFSEMMALPNSQLDTTYWLPWYNNADLDTQLRFANTTDQMTTIHVYIGGQEMPNSPFTLLPGQSTRRSFTNINNGPVQIVSDVPIVAAERLIYKVNGVPTSFSEMMALPNAQLDTIYWLPWYNNVDLDTQLRLGVP